MHYIWIAFGAALGGSARYWITGLVQERWVGMFPVGTLTVNILGSFLLGLFIFLTQNTLNEWPQMRLFWSVGFCGALTTFSTFSYETVKLMEDAEWSAALANVFLNVTLTIAGIFLAWMAVKGINWIGRTSGVV